MGDMGITMAWGIWTPLWHRDVGTTMAWGTWALLWHLGHGHGGCGHHYGLGDMGMGGVGITMDTGMSRGCVGGLWMWAENTGLWGDVTGTMMCGAGR